MENTKVTVQTLKIPIGAIEPNKGQIEGLPTNPRLIRDEKYEKLKQSIIDDPEMMELREILVIEHKGKYIVIAGNMRFRVLKDLGYKEAICKIIPEGTSVEKLKAYTIKDNSGFGEWDFDLLANEWDLDLLDKWGLDVPLIDLTPDDEPTEAEDDHFDIPDEIETDIKIGDLFEIKCNGLTHRILCGDSTKQEHVDLLMAGKQADALITHPPYNVDYQGGTAAKLKIENAKMNDANFRTFLNDAFKQASRVLKPGGAFYVYHASREVSNFVGAVVDNGLLYKQMLVWVKNSMTLGRQDYQWRHEPILYGWKDGASHYFTNNRSLTTVIEDQIDIDKLSKAEMRDMLTEMLSDIAIPQTIIREDKPLRNTEHPTMKPVKLLGRNIYNSTRMYETVLDLFIGSGTTLVAAHQLKRNVYGMELDEKYCQVVLDRFRKLEPECEINKIN